MWVKWDAAEAENGRGTDSKTANISNVGRIYSGFHANDAQYYSVPRGCPRVNELSCENFSRVLSLLPPAIYVHGSDGRSSLYRSRHNIFEQRITAATTTPTRARARPICNRQSSVRVTMYVLQVGQPCFSHSTFFAAPASLPEPFVLAGDDDTHESRVSSQLCTCSVPPRHHSR